MMNPFPRTFSTAIAFALVLAGCALPQPETSNPLELPSARTARVVRVDAQTASPASAAEGRFTKSSGNRYIRVKADQTGIVNADDDGKNTYLAFSSVLGPALQVYDQDGVLLRPTVVGAVVGVQGTHKGILIKRGDANSYVTPNPSAGNEPRPLLDRDLEVRAVIDQMMVDTQIMPAFARALEKSGSPSSQSASPTQRLPASNTMRLAAPPLVPVQAPPAADPTVMETADGRLIRVFFASGGRAVVRPDDGLLRLESEAVSAAIVRIVGYTDDVGSEEQNTILARARATSIRNFLIARGIPAEKVYASWLPKAKFIADNESAAGRALNRRVEVLFVSPVSRTISQAATGAVR